MILDIFDAVFYLPLYNGLVFLIDVVPLHDVGTALVILTLAVKFILYPLSKKASLSQYRMRALEPELSRIRDTHANDKAEQARKTMALYKNRGVNPFSSFLTLLLQIPILIALYLIFLNGGLPDINSEYLYSFIKIPELVDTRFIGLFDLALKSLPLAFLAGATQFFQARVALPPVPLRTEVKATPSFKDDFARSMNIQFRYVMPVFIGVIAYTLPSAIALYWSVGNLFAIVQELLVKRAVRAMG